MTLNVIVPVIVTLLAFAAAYRSLFRGPLKSAKNQKFENAILEILVAKSEEEDIQTAPLAAQHMFSSLHGLLRQDRGEQEHVSFEIAATPAGIKFYVAVPRPVKSFVENQIYAQYPACVIHEVEDYVQPSVKEGKMVLVTDLALSKEEYFPIKTFKDFELDPISAITSALGEIKEDEHLWLQVLVKPVPDVWQEAGHKYVMALREGTAKRPGVGVGNLLGLFVFEISEIFSLMVKNLLFPPTPSQLSYNTKPGNPTPPPRLTPGQELGIKAIENKLSKMGFQSIVRILSLSSSREVADSRLRSVTASLKQFSSADLNGFLSYSRKEGTDGFEMYRQRLFPGRGTYILNIEELATIYHLPSSAVETPNIAWAHAKRGEPPLDLPTEDCTLFGVTNFRNREITFGIKDNDRLRHMYLIGKSGTGKSQLFRNMIIQDMQNGKGVGVMDPHGTLIDELMDMVPDNRLEDVVYFDPSDESRPVALNMLEVLDPGQKNLMASGIVGAIKQHFGTISWGPRLEYLLNICILTLLEVEGTTLLGITRLLTDDNYRKFITYYVKDPVLKEFWDKEFKDMKANPKLVTEAVAPIQNKIGRFLSSSTIRNILGRPKSTVRIDDVMNSGKILFINLSKGKIGGDNANLLGSLLVSRIQFVALQRAKIPEKDRKPFYLFVDEFQNFASGSFESILSESRKYKLGLHITHQYTSQVPEDILNAVFGNVGTMICLALGAPDALVLAKEFAPIFSENDLISLERQQMYLKLLIDGVTSQPFSARSLPRMEGSTGNAQAAFEMSRQKFGQDKDYVEERIKLWVERKFDLGMAIAADKRSQKEVAPGVQGGVLPAGPVPGVSQVAPLTLPIKPTLVPIPQVATLNPVDNYFIKQQTAGIETPAPVGDTIEPNDQEVINGL